MNESIGEERTATDGGDGLQPTAPDNSRLPVPTQWLSVFDESAAARKAAEMAADLELLHRLMWSGYAGPEYDKLAERLIAYGFVVIRPWCRRNEIFAKVTTQLGIDVPGRRRLDNDAAEELAGATVTVAIRSFRTSVLGPGKWNPDYGASLLSYFVGHCVIVFVNEYRRWRREEDRGTHGVDGGVSAADALLSLGGGEGQDPERLALAASSLAETLQDLQPDAAMRQILAMKAAGYADGEIGDRLDLSVTAVWSRLYRFRQMALKGEHHAA